MKSNARTDKVIQMPQRTSYWLLVRNKGSGMEILTTKLPDGRRALPAFSFEEEAEMFLCLGGLRDSWRVRRTAAGELLSMFYTFLRGIECVTLDPIPENVGVDTSGLLSISREDFMDRLGNANGRGKVPGERDSKSPVFDEHRLMLG